MELHARHFKERTKLSEVAIINRIILLCYTACCLVLTAFKCLAGDSMNNNRYAAGIMAGYLVLMWVPPLFCKVAFYHFVERGASLRNILFGGFLLLYGYVLLVDDNSMCMLLAIPFMIMTVAYGSHLFTVTVTLIACVDAFIYTMAPHFNSQTYEVFVDRFYPFICMVATGFFLVIMAKLAGDAGKKRREQIEQERNRLRALASVGIKRIFEYDINKDVIVTARSKDGEYGDERVIEDFSTVTKQFRYVLFADWDRFDEFIEDCRRGRDVIEHQMRLRDHKGDYKWYCIKGRTMFDSEGKPEKVIGLLENIDDIKRLELRQADENKRDQLTKLYRYDYAKELMQQFLDGLSGENNTEYAGFLMLDIDNFDVLTDLMGKAFCDEILKNIASDLDDIFYTSDILGRVGGDEFVILMKNIKSIADIDKKIQEIQKVINRTYVGENVSFGSTVGIGAAVYPNDGESIDVLFEKAEKALLHAKQAGKNCYGFYSPENEELYSTCSIEEQHARIAMLSAEMYSTAHKSDSLIELAFKLIDESKDTDSAINLLIRQVARQMNLGGIRIKERVGKEYRLRNVYSCTMTPDMEFDNSDMSFEYNQWIELLNEYRSNNNLIVCENVMDLDNKFNRQIMLSLGARAYMGCAFYDKGEFVGSIDFVDFTHEREWTQDEITNVRAVANVVSSYLLKMKAYEDASDTVERLTGYDGVTGLLSYEKFLTLTGEYIESAPHGKYGIVYMDLSNFKYVNETYGYEMGDKILRGLAEECASYKDNYIYGSRVFSDNIVLFVRLHTNDDDELLSTLNLITKRFSDRMQIEVIDSKLLVDLGICTFEICGKPVPLKNIISNANVARKRTKMPDSPRVIIYDESMGEQLKVEVAYASDMENAFRNHEFVVYMQPKVNLHTNKIDGAEALIRWKKQDGTLIFPNDFIPVFEKNKSITLLDFYVYDEVCKYIRNRLDAGLDCVRISVNVSRVHLFAIDELIMYVKSLISKYKIPPMYLEFELTETVFTDKVDDTIKLLSRLKNLGVRTSMDDFGSGYSSLNVLTKLPIDVLKLDKEFLDDFENNPDEKIIIPSVIDMAKKLKLSVVCEGVETKEQVSFLREVGCDYAQGYFYSKPIPQEQFDELLEVQ